MRHEAKELNGGLRRQLFLDYSKTITKVLNLTSPGNSFVTALPADYFRFMGVSINIERKINIEQIEVRAVR